MKAIFTDIEGIRDGIYSLILDVYHKNRLELKGIDSIILKGTKSRSLGYNNIYRRCWWYKRTNRLSS